MESENSGIEAVPPSASRDTTNVSDNTPRQAVNKVKTARSWPMCSRCRSHRNEKIRVLKHVCPYKLCECSHCILLKRRNMIFKRVREIEIREAVRNITDTYPGDGNTVERPPQQQGNAVNSCSCNYCQQYSQQYLRIQDVFGNVNSPGALFQPKGEYLSPFLPYTRIKNDYYANQPNMGYPQNLTRPAPVGWPLAQSNVSTISTTLPYYSQTNAKPSGSETPMAPIYVPGSAGTYRDDNCHTSIPYGTN